jgi:hypothetical protein
MLYQPAELGGYREYYKWLHPRIHRRVNRICILDNSTSGALTPPNFPCMPQLLGVKQRMLTLR